jgi:hypothetical protein
MKDNGMEDWRFKFSFLKNEFEICLVGWGCDSSSRVSALSSNPRPVSPKQQQNEDPQK